jgi:hypothetical protein
LSKLIGQQQQAKTLSDLANLNAGATASSTASGAQPASRVSFSGDRADVAKSVTSELRAQGFSDHAIAGILYNINQESGFDPTLRHEDQPNFGGEAHYAHGLYQDGGDEWNTWAAHMQARRLDPNKAWSDPIEQTRYVVGRLKGTIGNNQYASVMAGLNAAKSPEEAAKIFARGYLKPAERYLNSRIADINRGIPGVEGYIGQSNGY